MSSSLCYRSLTQEIHRSDGFLRLAVTTSRKPGVVVLFRTLEVGMRTLASHTLWEQLTVYADDTQAWKSNTVQGNSGTFKLLFVWLHYSCSWDWRLSVTCGSFLEWQRAGARKLKEEDFLSKVLDIGNIKAQVLEANGGVPCLGFHWGVSDGDINKHIPSEEKEEWRRLLFIR